LTRWPYYIPVGTSWQFLFKAFFNGLLGEPNVETSPQSATQLYVKTAPAGATIMLDGKTIGRSDKIFNVAAGKHQLTLQLEGYVSDERSIDVREGEVTRVEVELKKRSDKETVLSHVGDSSEDRRSFADSGHAVAFDRPADARSIVAVKLFGARYGDQEPPDENFHVYLLDQDKKVLEQYAVPYSKIEWGDLQWHTLDLPATELPEKFFVAVWFNAEATKGVYLCMDKNVSTTHSYIGLPDKGYHKVDSAYEWMIRAVVSPNAGKAPTHPKVVTYEAEKAADTETDEAMPVRTWNDATGAFSVEAQFAGVEDGKVKLKKRDGKIVSVPLDRLSQEDRDFVASQVEGNGKKAKKADAAAKESSELAHDDGKKAGQSSIAGGGHAVRFHVDDGSRWITSVKLHGSRYGEARPPKENFHVWICNSAFYPIATFEFPYSSFTRGEPTWKTFRLRPTRVPKDFIVCFGFNPHQTKGIYVSYDSQTSETSQIGVPNGGQTRPFTKGNWLIRCQVENRAGGETKSE
jgi:hypothetical protein